MNLKKAIKSKRTWGLIALAALQIFKVNIPDEVTNLIHTITF